VKNAVQSWVWFAEGAAADDATKLNDAGRSYLALTAHLSVGDFVARDLNALAAATRCFALAANWSAAIETARKWIANAPQDARAYGRLD
jgi:hypothetical protein